VPIDALSVLCAQLMRDLFAIAKFLFKYGSESSMERKFLRSESSTGATVPWSESSWTFPSTKANVPGNESSMGTKVPSVDLSLPGTKVQRNEKSRYIVYHNILGNRTIK